MTKYLLSFDGPKLCNAIYGIIKVLNLQRTAKVFFLLFIFVIFLYLYDGSLANPRVTQHNDFDIVYWHMLVRSTTHVS